MSCLPWFLIYIILRPCPVHRFHPFGKRGMARIHVYRDTRFFMKAYCFSAMQGRRERHGLLKRRLRRLCLKRPYPAELPRDPWLPRRFFCRFFGPCRGLAVLKSLPLPGCLFPGRMKRQENQCQRLKKTGLPCSRAMASAIIASQPLLWSSSPRTIRKPLFLG